MPISAVPGRASRRILALTLSMAFILSLSAPASASSTGALSGTISTTGNKLVDDASITAVSPSGTYHATSDAKGFFAIYGVQQDTYTVIVTAPGFQEADVSGVTVNADQTTPFAVTLSPAVRTIGR